MSFSIDKYNDYIVRIDANVINELTPYYDQNKKFVLKLDRMLDHEFHDFLFETRYRNYYIYLNEKARTTAVRIYHGITTGGNLLPVIIDNNDNLHFVFVKDRTREYLTIPGGGRDNGNETFEECAVRETFEETGLTIDINSLRRLASHNSLGCVYGMNVEDYSEDFYCLLSLDQVNISDLVNFSNEEIEYIEIIPEIFLDSHQYNISSLHRMLAKYLSNKLRGEKYNWRDQDYLKFYNLIFY